MGSERLEDSGNLAKGPTNALPKPLAPVQLRTGRKRRAAQEYPVQAAEVPSGKCEAFQGPPD